MILNHLRGDVEINLYAGLVNIGVYDSRTSNELSTRMIIIRWTQMLWMMLNTLPHAIEKSGNISISLIENFLKNKKTIINILISVFANV